MGVASCPELGIVGPGAGITDGADASPVVEGITESVAAAPAHHHNPALAATARNGSWATVGPQCGAVALSQEWSGFGQERTGDDEAHSRQRAQDLEVAGAVIVVFIGELVQEGIELLATELGLFMHHPEARQKEPDMGPGRLGGPRGKGHGRFSQHSHHRIRIPTPNAEALQELLDGPALQADPRTGTGNTLGQLPEPGLVSGRAELEKVGRRAMDLIPEPVGEAVHLALQVFMDPGQLPDLDHQRMIDLHLSEAVPVIARRASART
jgi:hypothetical protein